MTFYYYTAKSLVFLRLFAALSGCPPPSPGASSTKAYDNSESRINETAKSRQIQPNRAKSRQIDAKYIVLQIRLKNPELTSPPNLENRTESKQIGVVNKIHRKPHMIRFLLVAKDFEPQYVAKVDPAKGPVKVKLERRNYADAPPGNTLLGRVVDSKGSPIVGAAVEAYGIHQKDGGGSWGSLQPGDGPAGTVVLPDGKPAFNVTVGLLCGGQQGMGIHEGKLRASRRTRNLVQITDASGHFSFAPELQMESLAAASPDGFKLVSLEELAANPKMVLEAWGRVHGTLHRPGGPGTNENLDLAFASCTASGGWSLDTGAHTITDEAGRFEFERVPPGKLNLSYRVKMSEQAWQEAFLQSITVNPGQTLELKVDAAEREARGHGSIIPRPNPARSNRLAIRGRVVLPDGKPAANVQVALIAPLEFVGLHKASLHSEDHGLQTVTDGAGPFTLRA